MKKIIVILLLIYSCVDQSPPKTLFTLTNDTEYEVKIESFARNRDGATILNGSIKGDDIIINPYGSFMIERVWRDNRTFYSIRNVDSIRLIFNTSKLKIFTCEDWPNFDSCSTIFRANSSYKHIISQDDLNDAIPLNN
ncbi:MAG: hypothetical protein ACPG8F_00965 [Flavobacteriaceae bacterium]